MALIGEIITKIKVDASQQKRGLAKAKKGFINFGKVAEKVSKGIGLALVGLTGSLVGFAAAMKASTNSIDNLAKTSAKLGVGSLELQKLRFAAETTGVKTQTLDMALQRMVRRLGEAAKGTGEAVKALKELGLDAQKLAKLTPDQQFARISEAMRKVGDQKDRVRLAFKIFDSEGVALVNTMNSNLEKSNKLFDSLGISLSKLDTKNVENFNDAWTQTSTILLGIRDKVWAKLSKDFQGLLNTFNAFLKSGGAEQIITGITSSIGGLINQFKRVGEGIKFMRADFTDFFESTAAGYKNITLLATDFIEASVNAHAKAKMILGDVFEAVANINPKALIGLETGVNAGNQGSTLFNDPLKKLLQPSKIAAASGGGPGKIELLVKTDPGAAIEILKKDKVVDSIVQTIIREETAKIGN